MAKKEEKLDEFNLDDFDLGFNINDNPEINKNNRDPVMNASANAYKGFKATVANKGFIEKVLRKVLPKGFSDAYDQAQKVVTQGRSLYNGVANDVRPAYADMSRAVRQLAPIVREKGSNGLADKLEKMFKDPNEGKSTWAPQDPDEMNMNQQLMQVFKLQAEDEEAKEQKDRAVDQIKERTLTRRHTDLMGQQSIVADGINTLVGYQKQITSRYQQKMLELNFRQYYAQRDMLGVLQAYVKDTHTQLESVIHNTALPDIIKMQASEQFVNQARQRMFGKVQERVGDHFRNYTDKMFANIEKEVRGLSSQVAMGLSMGAQLADAKRMEMEFDDGSEGEGVGGLAGKGLGYMFGKKLGEWGHKTLGRNKRVQDAGAVLGYHANNIPEALSQLRENRTYYGDWRDKAMDIGRRILPGPFQREKNLEGDGELGGGQMAYFDNQTHKSINVIMPGILTRILQSLEFSRTGRDPGRLVWNSERNAFTVQKQRTSDVAEAILGTSAIQSIRDAANNMVDRVDPDKKLSAEARRALADTLIKQADEGAAFSPSKLASGHVDFSDNPLLHSEIASHFRDRYQADAFGQTKKDVETYSRMSNDAGSFRSLRDAMPEVYASINSMVAKGNAEDLRALGILVPDPSNPRKEIIDYSFIRQRVGGQDWNINDASGMNEGNDKRRKKGRPPRGGNADPAPGPIPPTPPTPAPPVNLDPVTTGLSRGFDTMGQHFDRLIDAVTKSIGGLNSVVVEESGKQVKATEDWTAKPEATEALTWLERIAKMTALISRSKGKGSRRRKRGGGESGDDDGDADFDEWEDWDTMDGDFFDRARGYSGRGKRFASRSWKRGKAFAGRQYGNAKEKVGKAYDYGKGKAKAAADWVLGGRTVFQTAADVVGETWNSFQEVFDIYTSPEAVEPVMTAVKMRNGQYFDFYTKDPIFKFSDIKGPVADKDGNMVLTEDDIRNGLYGKNGKRVGNNLMRGAIRGLGMIADKLIGLPKAYYDMVKTVATKATNIAHNIIDGPADVYVKGEESPRLLAIIMRRNGYLSKATRKILKRPSEIDGEVLDLQGNTVLTIEDIQKGLVDSQGRPIVGVGGKLLRWAKSGFGLATKLAGKALSVANRVRKYAWDKTVKGAKALGRGVRSVGRFLGKGIHINGSFGIGLGVGFGGSSDMTPVVSGLEAIYNLLDDRLPGKSKFRTGSWQEKFSKRSSPKETMKKLKEASDSNPILKYLMMFGGAVMTGFAWLKTKLGGLFDMFKTGLGLKRGASVLGDAMDAGDALGEGGRRGRRGGRLSRVGRALGRGARAVGRGAATVGRVALAAAPVAAEAAVGIGSAAWTAVAGVGSAIAGLITAPVAIAAGVAVAGYFAYKYFKGRADPLQRLRLAEYGFDPSDKDALKKILELEGAVLPKVQLRGGQAQLDNVNMEDLLKRMEIPEDPNLQQPFVMWFINRFRPVFLRNVGELKKLAPNVAIMEVDDKLDKSQMVDFATASKTPAGDPNQPYRYGGQPFKDIDPLVTGTKVIDEELENIRNKFGKYQKKEKEKGTEATTPGQQLAKAGAVVAGVAAAANDENGGKPSTGTFQPSTQTYVTPSERTGGYEPGITAQQWTPGSNRLIDDLTAVRMRLYGLTQLDISQVNALTNLETNVQDYVSITSDGKVSMKKSAEGIFQENAGLFGRNPHDLQAQKEWVAWFNYRFLPVYVQFVNAVWAINRNIKPNLAWKYLRPEDMLGIAEMLKGVKANTPDGSVSVWGVQASAFAGMTSNNDITTIDTNLKSLRAAIKNNQLKEKTPNAALGRVGQGAGTEASNADAGQTQDGKTGMWQSIKNWFTGSSDKPGGYSTALGGATTQQGASYNTAWGGGGGGSPVAPNGMPIQQPGNGSGGDINQIPEATGDGWDAVKATIVAAAKMVGVDPGLMAAIAGVESGYRPTIAAPGSSAKGLFQFIGSTWAAMMKKYGPKYGINPQTPPTDARAAALLGGEYLKENQKALESKLGRPVTGTDLYMAHFLGTGGAGRFLKAPSGDPATMHVEANVPGANKSIFYAGGRSRTVSEVIDLMGGKIEKAGGKNAAEAQALAGNPNALKPANDPNAKSPEAANDDGKQASPGADGSAAFDKTQKQAQEFNSANGVPAAQPTPPPVGAGAGPAPAMAGAVSPATTPSDDSSTSTTASAPTEKETQSYVAATQSSARASKEKEQLESANGMLDVMNKQLETQQEMAESLKSLVELFKKGGVNISGGSGGAQKPMSTNASLGDMARNQNTPAGSERVQPPISMKRKTG